MKRLQLLVYLLPLAFVLWACSSIPPVIPEADPTFTVNVERTGSGEGRVTSTPAGIDCGTECVAAFEEGTSVTLMATPVAGSTFVDWQGPCSGSGECTLAVESDLTVGAEFADEAAGEPGDGPTDPVNDPTDPGDDDPFGVLLYTADAFDFEFVQHGFASSVHIDGSRALVITEGGNDVGQGGAFTYVESPDGWQRAHELPVVEIMGNESTGSAAALANGYAAVRYHCGTESSGPCSSGPSGLLVFEFGSGTWNDVANHRADNEGGVLGIHLSFTGDYLFSTDHDGTIHVHDRDDGSWPVVQQLSRAARGAMAVSEDDFFVVSERGVDHYRLTGGVWEYAGSLDQDRQGGRWVAADGERLVYSREEGEVTWVYTLRDGELVAEDDIDRFGPVALAGEHLLIGAPRNDERATDAGAVHVFEHSGTEWVRVNTLYAPDAGPGHNFGNRLDATAEFAIVGAFEDDYDRNDFQGSFYVFGHGSAE